MLDDENQFDLITILEANFKVKKVKYLHRCGNDKLISSYIEDTTYCNEVHNVNISNIILPCNNMLHVSVYVRDNYSRTQYK